MVVFMNDFDMKERGIGSGGRMVETIANDGKKRIVRGFKARPYASRGVRSAPITRIVCTHMCAAI
jgi:hypothetical protein